MSFPPSSDLYPYTPQPVRTVTSPRAGDFGSPLAGTYPVPPLYFFPVAESINQAAQAMFPSFSYYPSMASTAAAAQAPFDASFQLPAMLQAPTGPARPIPLRTVPDSILSSLQQSSEHHEPAPLVPAPAPILAPEAEEPAPLPGIALLSSLKATKLDGTDGTAQFVADIQDEKMGRNKLVSKYKEYRIIGFSANRLASKVDKLFIQRIRQAIGYTNAYVPKNRQASKALRDAINSNTMSYTEILKYFGTSIGAKDPNKFSITIIHRLWVKLRGEKPQSSIREAQRREEGKEIRRVVKEVLGDCPGITDRQEILQRCLQKNEDLFKRYRSVAPSSFGYMLKK